MSCFNSPDSAQPMASIVPPEIQEKINMDCELVGKFYRGDGLGNYAVLKLAVSSEDPELLEQYTAHIAKHNASLDMSIFPNSGFDLFVPEETRFTEQFNTKFVDLKVKGEMIYCDTSIHYGGDDSTEDDLFGVSSHCGYYVYPRSSMSKTPLMLANHVGIIDSGYRGNIISAVRNLSTQEYVVEKFTRLFQICHPSLCRIYVVLVEEADLTKTSRGEGGFGSTGITGATK